MAGAAGPVQPWTQMSTRPEVLMSVPPQPTPRDSAEWEVAGERPAHTRADKTGPVLVGLVLVAILVALVLLLLL